MSSSKRHFAPLFGAMLTALMCLALPAASMAAAPTASTGEATVFSTSAAVLNGSVNPNGLATTYRFEYGPTTAYGTSVPVPNEAIGSGSEPVPVAQLAFGLQPGVYHYRVVAQNAHGTTYGADRTFDTDPGGDPVYMRDSQTGVLCDSLPGCVIEDVVIDLPIYSGYFEAPLDDCTAVADFQIAGDGQTKVVNQQVQCKYSGRQACQESGAALPWEGQFSSAGAGQFEFDIDVCMGTSSPGMTQSITYSVEVAEGDPEVGILTQTSQQPPEGGVKYSTFDLDGGVLIYAK